MKKVFLITLFQAVLVHAQIVFNSQNTNDGVSIVKPTSVSNYEVKYSQLALRLNPNEAIYFEVPDSVGKYPVDYLILTHKQDPNTQKGDTSWDEYPGLTSVQLHSKKSQLNSNWRYWMGSASGTNGSKFAEIDYNWEIENLYEWWKYGHGAVINNENSNNHYSKELLYIDGMRLVNEGTDSVLVDGITIKLLTEETKNNQEIIFTPGTKFGNPWLGEDNTLGGGQKFNGLFPNAKIIQSGQDWRLKLKPNTNLLKVRIALGDSHPDQIINKDGGWGTKGWAKLSVGVEKKDGSISWLMENENVPPEGVLSAIPKLEISQTQILEGDNLILKSSSDTLYIMGVKVDYIQ